MQLFNSQPTYPAPQVKTFEIIARHFLAIIPLALDRLDHGTPSVESPFKGRAWSDSAERELNDGMANYRPGRS